MKNQIRIVIIEDELLTSEDLKRILLELDSNVFIVTQLQSVSEAFTFFSSREDFDLIFSDIKLGDGLSFEIFNSFKLNKPVVFCTAYNDFALEAFRSNGIDYLLKPFNSTTVLNALNKYKRSELKKFELRQQLPMLLNDLNINVRPKIKRILVEKGRRSIPIDIDQLAVIYIEDRITFTITYDQQKYLLSGSLESIHAEFGDQFYRANRKYLLHKKAIIETTRTTDRKLKLKLKVDLSEDVFIGKMKTTEFLNWLVK